MQRKLDRSAFTLVEVLIVVVILGILAAIVIPQFSNASATARENTLRDEMRYLRTQIAVYRAQHNDYSPGYAPGSGSGVATEANFELQMTTYTDEQGNANPTGSAVFKYGPYLSRMPKNPLNTFSTFTIIADGAPMPAAPDGTTGYYYKPETQQIAPNVVGTDSSGAAYYSY
ncbi:MAG TPA: prepilin-type N-terminal cleavage/methylation domain-containing protein [Tepidisphaeraceae bacterium]|nr:prepilin-type N-terminal cleavage/methylation domain-containing protein [Tepidisphaeraceae bacterium]